MFVMPAMMLKGVHWGYTKFYLQRFIKPINYTEDEFIRRFHPDDDLLIKKNTVPVTAEDVKHMTKEEAHASGGDLSLCPVGPVLKLFGLGKKKPSVHPPEAKEELLNELSNRTMKMQ